MRHSKFPPGWDEERVRRLLEHYESESDEEALAEDEAAFESMTHTIMEVPVDIVPAVRELIAKRRAERLKLFFQPLDRGQIQMVRGFVQKQDVRRRSKHAGKGSAACFPAR